LSMHNWVMQQATERSDYGVQHLDDYLTKVTNITNGAYNTYQGTNYTINRNLTHMSKSDADAVANYSIDRTYNYLLHKDKAKIATAKAQGILTMSVTPTHEIIVRDVHGGVTWVKPLSDGVISSARIYAKSGKLVDPTTIDKGLTVGKKPAEAIKGAQDNVAVSESVEQAGGDNVG
jgi:hypothetical protein